MILAYVRGFGWYSEVYVFPMMTGSSSTGVLSEGFIAADGTITFLSSNRVATVAVSRVSVLNGQYSIQQPAYNSSAIRLSSLVNVDYQPGLMVRVPDSSYFIAGGLVNAMASGYLSNIFKLDISSSNFLVFNQTQPNSKNTSVSSATFLSDIHVLVSRYLTIYDHTTFNALRSYDPSSTKEFRYLTCRSSTSCSCADMSSTKIVLFMIDSLFISGQSNTIGPYAVVGNSECTGSYSYQKLSFYIYSSEQHIYVFNYSHSIVAVVNIFNDQAIRFTWFENIFAYNMELATNSLFTVYNISSVEGLPQLTRMTVCNLKNNEKPYQVRLVGDGKYVLVNHEVGANIRLFARNPCSPKCQLCNDLQVCLKCVDGSYLDTSACFPCMTGCQICSQALQCHVCEPDRILHPAGACKPVVNLYPSIEILQTHVLLSNLSVAQALLVSVQINGSQVDPRPIKQGFDWYIPLELPFNSSMVVVVQQSTSFNQEADSYVVVHQKNSSRENFVQTPAITPAIDTLTSYNDKYSDVVILLASLDSSGLIVKFSQMLKIYNKLYFMNIKHPSRLHAHLKQLSQAARDPRRFAGPSRGMITRDQVLSNIFVAFAPKLVCYIVFFYVRTVLRFVVRPAYWVLMGITVLDKLYLLVLNAVIFDISLYAPITFLLCTEPMYLFASGFCFVLLVLDLLDVLLVSLDDRKWRRYFKKLVDPELDISSPIRMKSPEEKSTILKVDLKQTFENVKINSHLMNLLASGLRPDYAIYSLKLPRLIYLSNQGRLSLYYIVIGTCQSSAPLGATAILAIEVCKVVLTTIYHIRFRIFQRHVSFFLEVSQSAFMAFLMLLFLAESVAGGGEGSSTLAIYVTVVSVFVEYVLLLSYILQSAYLTCKNRKQPKKQKPGLLWFVEKSSAQNSGPTGRPPKPGAIMHDNSSSNINPMAQALPPNQPKGKTMRIVNRKNQTTRPRRVEALKNARKDSSSDPFAADSSFPTSTLGDLHVGVSLPIKRGQLSERVPPPRLAMQEKPAVEGLLRNPSSHASIKALNKRPKRPPRFMQK